MTANDTVVNSGILYLCATPIGNMEDMTYRAVRILREADLIAAEDTRHTRKLLAHFDIHTPLISYHEHNKREQGEYLIAQLKAGKTIVCVSDAGLPTVADPGADLVRLAIESNITVSPLPGANAALSALICSGLSTEGFRFVGFLPKTKAKRQTFLQKLAAEEVTLIFYEAPHRLRDVLRELLDILGDRPAVVARELTKKFEEFRRGTLDELNEFFTANEPRGEFVILVTGSTENVEQAVKDLPPADIAVTYQKFVADGFSRKDAMRETAKKIGIGRREVYNAVMSMKNI